MDPRSRSIEVSARSVEEAITSALRQLGLDRDQVDIQVLKPGSRGLLGLLSEDARVRVTAKASAAAQEKEDALLGLQDEEQARETRDQEPTEVASDANVDELARLGAEVLQGLLSRMGLRARVARERTQATMANETEAVVLNIHGVDLGVLIGRRGETLSDLQFLTCLLTSRRTQHWPNLIVDVEHYKARREKALMDLARRMAGRVRSTKEPVALEPMPAHERRIVHLALRGDPEVFTESSGQDEERKVVIKPRK
ncbi:MAG: KH domain-containing protein [Chloroflexi bacterium]|nr:KH domain-containing protein [Chloroflexota bacterium]